MYTQFELNKFNFNSNSNLRNTLIIGKRGCGKTQLTSDLLLKHVKSTDLTFVFSSDPATTEFYNNLPIKKHVCQYDASVIKNLLTEREIMLKYFKLGELPHIYIVFDQYPETRNTMNYYLEELLMNCRHYGVSVILLSQSIHSVHTKLRHCFDKLFLFDTSNNEKISFYKNYFKSSFDKQNVEKPLLGELLSLMKKKQNFLVFSNNSMFNELLSSMQQKYNCLVLDLRSFKSYYYNSQNTCNDKYTILCRMQYENKNDNNNILHNSNTEIDFGLDLVTTFLGLFALKYRNAL